MLQLYINGKSVLQQNTGKSGWTNTVVTFVHRSYDLEVSRSLNVFAALFLLKGSCKECLCLETYSQSHFQVANPECVIHVIGV
jgi:hypothetical protein